MSVLRLLLGALSMTIAILVGLVIARTGNMFIAFLVAIFIARVLQFVEPLIESKIYETE